MANKSFEDYEFQKCLSNFPLDVEFKVYYRENFLFFKRYIEEMTLTNLPLSEINNSFLKPGIEIINAKQKKDSLILKILDSTNEPKTSQKSKYDFYKIKPKLKIREK